MTIQDAAYRGNGTSNLWGIAQDDGAIISVSETEARKHWTQRQQAAADATQESKEAQ